MWTLCSGQRGEVYEVNDDHIAVVFDTFGQSTKEVQQDEKGSEPATQTSVCWIDVKDIERDLDARVYDCHVAMEALCEVMESQQPLVVYFPDSSLWLSRAVPKSNRKEFIRKVREMFDHLAGPVVLICGQNKVETGSKEKEKFTMILPNLGRLAKLPLPLKRLSEGLKPAKQSEDNEIYTLFTNVICISPPKEEDLLRIFTKQIEEDRRIVISRSNLNEMHMVLEEHGLLCMDLLYVNTDSVILTKRSKNVLISIILFATLIKHFLHKTLRSQPFFGQKLIFIYCINGIARADISFIGHFIYLTPSIARLQYLIGVAGV